MNKKNEEIIYQDNYRCHYLKVIKNKNDEIIGRALRGTAHRNSGEICDPVSGKSKEEVVNKLKKEVDRSLDKNKSPEEAVQEKTTPVSGSEQVTSELPLATSTLSEISVQKIIHEPSSEQTEKSVQPLNNSGSSDTPVSEQTIAPDPSSEQLSKSVQPVNASGFPASETQTSEQVVTPELPSQQTESLAEEAAKNAESSFNTKVESGDETITPVPSETSSGQVPAATASPEELPTPKKRASTKKNVYSITTDSEVFPLIKSISEAQTDLKNEVKRIIEKQAELTKEVNTIKQYMIDLKSNISFIRGEVSSEASSQKHLQSLINGVRLNLDQLCKENAAHDQTQKRQFEDQEKRFNNIMDTISAVVKHSDPVHDQLATLRDRSDSLHQRLDAKIDLQDAEAVIKLREEIEKHVRAELIRSISKEIMLAVEILSESVQGYDAELISTVKNIEDRCKRAGLIASDKLFPPLNFPVMAY